MITRRIIRIKVMQTLYAAELMQQEGVAIPATGINSQKILDQHFSQTRSLLGFLCWVITETARYAEIESHKRANKHLPQEEDLNVNIKIAGNDVVWKIVQHPEYERIIAIEKPQARVEENFIRKLFLKLAETPEYQHYIQQQGRTPAEEKKIIEFILTNLLLDNEDFISAVEELYTNWNDDGDMVTMLISGFIQKPGNIQFDNILDTDKRIFANTLLKTVLEKNDYLQSIIKDKLKNWDAERIAHLDMILMKMGIAEFLYFDTIPPKVTINEYIDLAKDYSTPQSGQFVNGILDGIHKDLIEKGLMQKTEYKKR